MPWVRFTELYDYRVPGKRVLIAYKPGRATLVTRDCAEKAIAAGKAVSASRPKLKADADAG